MIEWYDFPNVKSTKMLSFLFGSRGLWPDLPSPFERKPILNPHSSFRSGFTPPGQDSLEALARLACDSPRRVFISDFTSAFTWHMTGQESSFPIYESFSPVRCQTKKQ